MKINGKGVQLCTCGRLERERKSFFSTFDIKLGVIVIIAGTIYVLLPLHSLIGLALLYLIFGLAWLIFFTIWMIKSHSFKCAVRWASVVTVGNLGGGIIGAF